MFRAYLEKMERAILSICILLIANTLQAQTEKGLSEVSLSLGLRTLDQSNARMVNFFAVSDKRGISTYKIDERNIRGAIGLTYRYYYIDRASIGLTVVNDKIEHEYSLSPNKITGIYNYLAITIAPELNYLYINATGISLYSLVGFSYTYSKVVYKDDGKGGLSDENIFYHKNVQITPIGVRLGDNSIGAYVELGFGYKGLLNIGISSHF